jgi:hypothetical protein
MSFSNKFSNKLSINKIYTYALVGILVLALSIRLIGLNKGIWLDETFTIGMISKESLLEMLQSLRSDTHPPLNYVLLYFWSKISNSEEFLRLLSVLFGMGTVAVVMRWIKQYSLSASLLAGLYFATNPIMLRFSHEIRNYQILVFATALAFLFASRAIAKPEKLTGYIGLAVSLTVAISSHLIGIMLIAPIFVFIVFMTVLEQKKVCWSKAILAVITPFLVFIYFYFFYLKTLTQRQEDWWMPSVSWHLFSSTAQYLFGLSSLYFSSYFDDLIAFIFLATLAIAFTFGNWKQNFAFLWATMIFCLEIIIYSWVKTPIFWYRNILPALVPFVGFIVLQIATIQTKKIKIASILLLTLLSLIFTTNWVTVQAYGPVEYYKKVAQLVNREWQPNNLVVFYPGYIADTVNYYLVKIPSEDRIVAGIPINKEKLERDIKKKIAIDNRNKSLTTFLILRIDLSVQIEDFKNLLSAIKSQTKIPFKLKVFSLISHDYSILQDRDISNSFLAVLKSQFGKPLSYQEEKAYILSEHEL